MVQESRPTTSNLRRSCRIRATILNLRPHFAVRLLGDRLIFRKIFAVDTSWEALYHSIWVCTYKVDDRVTLLIILSSPWILSARGGSVTRWSVDLRVSTSTSAESILRQCRESPTVAPAHQQIADVHHTSAIHRCCRHEPASLVWILNFQSAAVILEEQSNRTPVAMRRHPCHFLNF